MATQREYDMTRRAIRALLNGEETEGATARTCGKWWCIVVGLRQAYAKGGTDWVKGFIPIAQQESPVPEASQRFPPLPSTALIGEVEQLIQAPK